LLEIVDTIVNVALTNMRGSLGATLTDVACNYCLCYCKCDCNPYDQLALTAIWKTKLFCRFNNYFHRRFFYVYMELVTFRFIQGLEVALY
jgi:hypothetical protein